MNRIEKGANGHLLIVTKQGFGEWDGTRLVNEQKQVSDQLHVNADEIYDVIDDQAGTRWFCTRAGLAQRKGNDLTWIAADASARKNAAIPEHNGDRAEHAYVDGAGSKWVQFSRRLYRLSGTRLEPLVQSSVREIYSDRDGDLWAGTNGEGLFRYKDRAVRVLTTKDGLPSDRVMALLSRHDGSLWAGTNCGGLSVYVDHRFRAYSEHDGLLNSCVWSLAEDRDSNLWVGTWGGGLFRFKDGHFKQFSKAEGLGGEVVRGIVASQDGSLWTATDGGVSHLVNGRFRNYTTVDGLSSTNVLAVYQDRQGCLWAGTSRGIDRLDGEHFTAISAGASRILDPRSINFAETPAGELYVMGALRGLSRVHGDRLMAVNRELDLFHFMPAGDNLWFSGGNGVFRFTTGALKQDEAQQSELPVAYTSFGIADGMKSTQCSVGTPNMAITPDHKLWVATVKGVAELDIDQLAITNDKPGLFVSEATIGRKQQSAGSGLLLPPGTHHTELHFDSISLKSPEKIRFQYRMDGVDAVWLDANSSLTAVYTNIPSGSHVFHLRACNVAGVWDPVGISYGVMQQPQVYETAWFRWSAVLAGSLLLGGLYRLRLRQIADQFNSRLEERVSERTRIARDLHDTLLQSFHGLMLRFQAVQNMLPDQPLEAEQSLQTAIDRAAKAITEGRNAVQELRSENPGSSDFVQSLTSIGHQLAVDHSPAGHGGNAATFEVLVEGAGRRLQPGLLGDVHCIAREALANAFRHAQARHVEADLRFGSRTLRMRIRDDGIGISPSFLAQGRDGHWGLPGMRERAREMGGRLEVWSELNRGTEVELTIPAAIAYKKSKRRKAGNE